MSNDFVTARVKRDHIHLMNRLFEWDGAKWVARPEVFFGTPGIAVDMGNFVGALNHFEREQYPDGNPLPAPATPLEAFRARQAVSQNCAWTLVTPAESGAVRDALTAAGKDPAIVSQYNQFYTVGGSGALGVAERIEPKSPSGYVYADASGEWANDVGGAANNLDGAADKRVTEIGASQDPPRKAPAPLSI